MTEQAFANPYLQVKSDGLWIVLALDEDVTIRRRLTRERARELHRYLEFFVIDNDDLP